MVRGILVPWSGIEPVPPALEAWSLNHWTASKVLLFFLFTESTLDFIPDLWKDSKSRVNVAERVICRFSFVQPITAPLSRLLLLLGIGRHMKRLTFCQVSVLGLTHEPLRSRCFVNLLSSRIQMTLHPPSWLSFVLLFICFFRVLTSWVWPGFPLTSIWTCSWFPWSDFLWNEWLSL